MATAWAKSAIVTTKQVLHEHRLLAFNEPKRTRTSLGISRWLQRHRTPASGSHIVHESHSGQFQKLLKTQLGDINFLTPFADRVDPGIVTRVRVLIGSRRAIRVGVTTGILGPWRDLDE